MRTRCTANSESDIFAAWKPCGFQTSQAAVPIGMNRVVHTGPNAPLGRFHVGLASVLYQLLISGIVAMAVRYNGCVPWFTNYIYDNSTMIAIFRPLLALIASVTDKELARYVDFLKAENEILRSRVPGQIHTKPEERQRLLDLGKPLGKAIEELITIVKPSTSYRWCRDGVEKKKAKNPKGGQRGARI